MDGISICQLSSTAPAGRLGPSNPPRARRPFAAGPDVGRLASKLHRRALWGRRKENPTVGDRALPPRTNVLPARCRQHIGSWPVSRSERNKRRSRNLGLCAGHSASPSLRAYPAADVLALYARRWDIAVFTKELKVDLREARRRCRATR